MAKRAKAYTYAGRLVNRYFWRTYDQKETELIKEQAVNCAALRLNGAAALSKEQLPRNF